MYDINISRYAFYEHTDLDSRKKMLLHSAAAATAAAAAQGRWKRITQQLLLCWHLHCCIESRRRDFKVNKCKINAMQRLPRYQRPPLCVRCYISHGHREDFYHTNANCSRHRSCRCDTCLPVIGERTRRPRRSAKQLRPAEWKARKNAMVS